MNIDDCMIFFFQIFKNVSVYIYIHVHVYMYTSVLIYIHISSYKYTHIYILLTTGLYTPLATKNPLTTMSVKVWNVSECNPPINAIISPVILKAAFSNPKLPPGEMPSIKP